MASELTYRRLAGPGHQRAVPIWTITVVLLVIGMVLAVIQPPWEVIFLVMPALFLIIAFIVFLFQGRRVELWENENHLLLVETDFSREYYKRFKYSDIQAILWRKTSESKITAVVFVVTTLLLVAGTVAPVPSILRISCAVCAVMSTGFVLRNALAGESCRCFVRTAVQTVNLASLTRVKQAEKVLEIVRPRIVAAQGKLAPEEIPSRMQEFHAVAGQSAGAGYVTDDPNAPPRIVA